MTLGSIVEAIDTSTWVDIDEGGLPDDRRALFHRRKDGVQALLDGADEARIKEVSGFTRTQIYRLLTERCLVTLEDGLPAGWRGLQPFSRLGKPYTRNAPLEPDDWGVGFAGAMQLFFSTPKGHALRRKFEARILQKLGKRSLQARRKSKQDLFVWFLQEAEKLFDVPVEHWPFSRKKLGKVSIYRFIDSVLDDNPAAAVAIEGGPEAVKKSKAGDGTDRPRLRLFQRTECDAHKTDVRSVVNVPNPAGGYSPKLIHRIWVIVIIEVASRCVLGYAVSTRREPSKDDVLRAVRNALSQWKPKEITFSKDLKLLPKAGFPSKLGQKFIGASWDEMSVDGALANICKTVRVALKDVVGANLISPLDASSFTSRRSLDDRPYVERFFRLFSDALVKLAPGTGANPAAKRGRDPEAAALESNFQLEHLEELLEVLCANYNGTPHSSLGQRTPLDQVEFLASRPDFVGIRNADPRAVSRLLGARKKCRVLTKGLGQTDVYINFENASYTSEWLKSRRDLFNEELDVYLEDEFDARFATASYRGEILGILRAKPPWHQTPHTLYMRSAIKSLDTKRIIDLASAKDPVIALCEAAEQEPGKRLKVHPAYLEARRVFEHFAKTAIPEPLEVDAGAAEPAPAEPPTSSRIAGSSTATFIRRRAINSRG